MLWLYEEEEEEAYDRPTPAVSPKGACSATLRSIVTAETLVAIPRGDCQPPSRNKMATGMRENER